MLLQNSNKENKTKILYILIVFTVLHNVLAFCYYNKHLR
jgi:hypothetical protein